MTVGLVFSSVALVAFLIFVIIAAILFSLIWFFCEAEPVQFRCDDSMIFCADEPALKNYNYDED